MTGDPLLELGERVLVAAEQVEHVLRGAHRALDAAQGVAREELLDPLEPDHQLVGDGREPLAQCGRLGRHVVGAAGHHGGLVLGGQAGQSGQRGHGPVAHQLEGLPDLELLDVLGQVAGGHPLVDVLVPGEGGELLDPRLDVVARHPLARGDRGEVDALLTTGDDLLVGLDHAVGYVDPELALGTEDGDPEPALEDDLVLG